MEDFPDLTHALTEHDEALDHAERAYQNARTIRERQAISKFIQTLTRQRRGIWTEMTEHARA